MKRHSLCFMVLLVFLALSAAAQNFRPVPLQTQALYVSFNDQRILKFLTATPPTPTDSLVLMRESFYHKGSNGAMFKLLFTSNTLLGDSLHLKPDGKYTSKVANAYWFEWDFRPGISSFVVYSDSTLLVQANLTQTDSINVVGNMTAVRKYTITSNIAGWFGPVSVWLSEDYGVVRSNTVFLEPALPPYWDPRSLSLEGIQIGNTDFGFVDPSTVVSYQVGDVFVYYITNYNVDGNPQSTYSYRRYTLLQRIDTMPGYERWEALRQDYSAEFLTLKSSVNIDLVLDRLSFEDIGLNTLYWSQTFSSTVYFRKYHWGNVRLLEQYNVNADSIFMVDCLSGLNFGMSMSEVMSDRGMTYAISRSPRRGSCPNYVESILEYSSINGQQIGIEPNFAATSISELKLHQNQFQVYPSPFDAYLNLQSSYQGKLNYRISALNGQSLREATLQLEGEPVTIQTSEFLPGMYLLYLWEDGQEAKAVKIVKY